MENETTTRSEITPLQIEVLECDIEKGTERSTSWCPIARSLRRAGHKRISVDADEIRASGKTYKTPAKAREFINTFDYSGTVKPFVFTVKPLNKKDESF